jgi:hypothetical protein
VTRSEASRATNSVLILPENGISLWPATATSTTRTEYSVGHRGRRTAKTAPTDASGIAARGGHRTFRSRAVSLADSWRLGLRRTPDAAVAHNENRLQRLKLAVLEQFTRRMLAAVIGAHMADRRPAVGQFERQGQRRRDSRRQMNAMTMPITIRTSAVAISTNSRSLEGDGVCGMEQRAPRDRTRQGEPRHGV